MLLERLDAHRSGTISYENLKAFVKSRDSLSDYVPSGGASGDHDRRSDDDFGDDRKKSSYLGRPSRESLSKDECLHLQLHELHLEYEVRKRAERAWVEVKFLDRVKH